MIVKGLLVLEGRSEVRPNKGQRETQRRCMRGCMTHVAGVSVFFFLLLRGSHGTARCCSAGRDVCVGRSSSREGSYLPYVPYPTCTSRLCLNLRYFTGELAAKRPKYSNAAKDQLCMGLRQPLSHSFSTIDAIPVGAHPACDSHARQHVRHSLGTVPSVFELRSGSGAIFCISPHLFAY